MNSFYMFYLNHLYTYCTPKLLKLCDPRPLTPKPPEYQLRTGMELFTQSVPIFFSSWTIKSDIHNQITYRTQKFQNFVTPPPYSQPSRVSTPNRYGAIYSISSDLFSLAEPSNLTYTIKITYRTQNFSNFVTPPPSHSQPSRLSTPNRHGAICSISWFSSDLFLWTIKSDIHDQITYRTQNFSKLDENFRRNVTKLSQLPP